jgi:hypothetical protein
METEFYSGGDPLGKRQLSGVISGIEITRIEEINEVKGFLRLCSCSEVVLYIKANHVLSHLCFVTSWRDGTLARRFLASTASHPTLPGDM